MTALLKTRSWWMKGERVVWVVGERVVYGTVVEPRGDRSWVAVDGTGGDEWRVSNGALRKLTPELDPRNRERSDASS
jgi:hypothetical protein